MRLNNLWLLFVILFFPVSQAMAVPAPKNNNSLNLPDLYTLDLQLNSGAMSGEVDISLSVYNDSYRDYLSGEVVVHFLTGDDADSAVFIEAVSIDSIQSYDIANVNVNFTHHNLKTHLYAVVDPNNAIIERQETNNNIELNLSNAIISKLGHFSLEVPSDQLFLGDVVSAILRLDDMLIPNQQYYIGLEVKDPLNNILFTSQKIPVNNGQGTSVAAEFSWPTVTHLAGHYHLYANLYDSNDDVLDYIVDEITLRETNKINVIQNQAPIAADDHVDTFVDQMVTVDVLVNDLEPDGNRLMVHLTDEPLNGYVYELRGLIEYSPNYNFVGVDQFSYQLNDTLGGSDWANVTVNVLPQKEGCTWLRDFALENTGEAVSIKGWADYPEPTEGANQYAAHVISNDNPDLFEVQPRVSYPSCSLYYKAKPGAVGFASVTYEVVDSETRGKKYTSDERSFEMMIKPQAQALEIVTTPETQMEIGQAYRYQPILNKASSAQLYSLKLPKFLTNAGGILVGTPEEEDIGMHKVTVFFEQDKMLAEQSYFLTVTPRLEKMPVEETPIGTQEPQPKPLDDESIPSTNTQLIQSTGGGGPLGIGLLLLAGGILIGRKL